MPGSGDWNILESSVIVPTDEPNTHKVSLRSLLLNFIFLYSIAVAAETIPRFTGTVKRGFFCDDEDIMYPHREDTFSASFLFTYCTLMPFIVICLVELYRLRREQRTPDTPTYRIRNSTIPIYLVRVFTYFAYAQIGFVAVLVLTNTTKCVAGRLRPHFMSVCKPVGTNCSVNPKSFEQNYTCTGDNALVQEARKSFFSGHSSLSMYATIYAVLYIQARMSKIKSKVFVPIMQTLLIAFGLSICYSRVSDYMHHWSDVLIGIFVGSFIGAYSCICWAELFKCPLTSSLLPTSASPFMLMDDGRRNSLPSPMENISATDLDVEQGASTASPLQKI